MREIKAKAAIYIVLLFLLIFFHCVNNFIWLYDCNAIAGVDSQNHLLFQLHFFDYLINIAQDYSLELYEKWFALINLLRSSASGIFSWPALVYFISSFFMLFDRSLLAVRLSMLPYFFILIISTYGIGKRIANRSSGLLAALLISFYPMIFESSRQYQLDFPLTAIVAMSIFLLLRCDNFKQRRWAMLCGLSFGIGMHIKGQSLFFVMPVLAASIINSLFLEKSSPENSIKRKLLNLGLFAVIFVGVSALWWLDKLSLIKEQFIEHLGHPDHIYYSHAGMERYSLSSVSWYLKALFFNAVGPVFFTLFLLSFLWLLKARHKYRSVLILWISVPLLLFSLVLTIKHSRYLMPILPAMALVSSLGLTQLKNRKLRYTLISLVFIFGLWQFLAISYKFNYYHQTPLGKARFYVPGSYEIASSYTDFKIDDLTDYIRKRFPEPEDVSIAYIPLAQIRPGDYEVSYWFKIKDAGINVINLAERGDVFFQYFNRYKFILFYSNSLPEFNKIKETYAEMLFPGKYREAFPDEERFPQLLELLSQFRVCYQADFDFDNDSYCWYLYCRTN